MAASLFSPSLPVRSPPPPYALLSSTAQRSGFCNCWISRCRRGTRVGGLRSRGEFGVRTPRGDQRLQRSRACFMKVSCKVDVIEEGEFAEKVLGSDVPVLVEFVATWCGPCRLIAPAVESAAEEYKEKLKIVKIDHDSNPKLIEEYKVYGLPTLILFRNGQEVPQSRREGAITKVKLKEYLDAQLEVISAR